MTRIGKFAVQINLVLSVCAVLLGGCESVGTEEIEGTPAEKEKAKLLRAIGREFENPQAHFELGQLYQADGLWTQAERQYNVALSFDPVHREAQAAMVKVLADSGDAAKSVLSADIYMNRASSSAAGSLRLGLAFQRQGLDEYAMACYRQALHLAPNSAKVNRQIGYYYLSRNERVRALDYLRRSFQLNPNQPEVAGELGRLGVAVEIPRETEKSTSGLDEIVEESDRSPQTQ